MWAINDVQAGVISNAPTIGSILDKVLLFVISIVGALAMIGVIVSGIMYMTSGGESKRVSQAKKALTASVIGLVVAILSLIIVKTVIGFF
ncbi:MAG: hypothetical protein WC819_05035 [Parcubacteria group bacterium]|jgi:hypothetical protein